MAFQLEAEHRFLRNITLSILAANICIYLYVVEGEG